MAKKQKRSVSSGLGKEIRDAQNLGIAVEEARPAVMAASRTTSEFNPDHTPIVQDLKRIGILAGSFFAILIILSFFLK